MHVRRQTVRRLARRHRRKALELSRRERLRERIAHLVHALSHPAVVLTSSLAVGVGALFLPFDIGGIRFPPVAFGKLLQKKAFGLLTTRGLAASAESRFRGTRDAQTADLDSRSALSVSADKDGEAPGRDERPVELR
jgi:hypothetical protein